MTAVPLWTGEAVLGATGGEGAAGWQATGVSIDSRTILPGELFVPLAGPNFNGHDFIADAFAKGAAAALSHCPSKTPTSGGPVIRVADTLAALRRLGCQRRAESGARIVAITGSVGKTGTKEALRLALSAEAKVHASAASFNNHWGVPLSLARMPLDADYGIFEMGMNHPGEIAALTRMVRPHLALITAIAPAHLAVFASVAEIARAKAEIFQGLAEGGTAVLCRDSEHYPILVRAAEAAGARRIVGFGEDVAAEARLLRTVEHPDCVCATAEIMGQAVAFKVGAAGRHWAMNGLAVLAAVQALGADLGKAALSLAKFTPMKGRGQRHRVALAGGTIEVIDESYNASPASLRAALAVLGSVSPKRGGRRIAVLGDMLELGADAEALHVALAEALLAADVDLAFVCGANMAALLAALPASRRGGTTETSAELVDLVTDAVRPGDVAMVKGSLAMAMAPIVEALIGLGGGGTPIAVAG
jgi:UDP-N-acetylmuramoyl-tripeptide--D-alanyl-D-alanine ligase